MMKLESFGCLGDERVYLNKLQIYVGTNAWWETIIKKAIQQRALCDVIF